jgi:hypothetical protein
MTTIYHPIITEITELEIQLGASDSYDFEVFQDYKRACHYREMFLEGKLGFTEYLEALSSCSVDVDDYLEGITFDLMKN